MVKLCADLSFPGIRPVALETHLALVKEALVAKQPKHPRPPPTTQMTAPNNLSASMTNVATNPTTTMLAKPVDQPEADMSTVAVGTN